MPYFFSRRLTSTRRRVTAAGSLVVASRCTCPWEMAAGRAETALERQLGAALTRTTLTQTCWSYKGLRLSEKPSSDWSGLLPVHWRTASIVALKKSRSCWAVGPEFDVNFVLSTCHLMRVRQSVPEGAALVETGGVTYKQPSSFVRSRGVSFLTETV
jgi:hypothetical protein